MAQRFFGTCECCGDGPPTVLLCDCEVEKLILNLSGWLDCGSHASGFFYFHHSNFNGSYELLPELDGFGVPTGIFSIELGTLGDCEDPGILIECTDGGTFPAGWQGTFLIRIEAAVTCDTTEVPGEYEWHATVGFATRQYDFDAGRDDTEAECVDAEINGGFNIFGTLNPGTGCSVTIPLDSAGTCGGSDANSLEVVPV